MYRRKNTVIILTTTLLVFLGVIYYFLPVSPFTSSPFNRAPVTESAGVRVELVTDELSIPWSLEFLPNGDLLFTQRDSKLMLLREGSSIPEHIGTIESALVGEGGLLGLALDPEFALTRQIYLYYTYRSNDTLYNRITKHILSTNNRLDPMSEKIVLDKIPAGSIHNGGRIKFGPDGKLYATTGDVGKDDLAQDLNSLAGKILRINFDGSIPNDNPFNNSPVYSYGHRNPQGLAWHPESGELFITEHGPRAHDEVNKIEHGANYGWPRVIGIKKFDPLEDSPITNTTNPVIESELNTWAPSGASFYDGDLLPHEWKNKLIFAGLRSQALFRLDVSSDKPDLDKIFSGEYGRLRDVAQAPNGTLYFATSNRDGRGNPTDSDDRILRVVPN